MCTINKRKKGNDAYGRPPKEDIDLGLREGVGEIHGAEKRERIKQSHRIAYLCFRLL